MSRVAVAGPSIIVTEAAGRAVEEGGSVVDAAIVASLTAMCTEPGICAPGGGGFLTIHVPGRSPVVIDGYMSYPGIDFEGEPHLESVTMTYGGGVTTLVRAGSIAVPGVFAGLAMASDLYGTAPWRVLMDICAESVDHGFPLGAAAHHYLTHAGEPIFSNDPAVRAALFEDDRLRDKGELIVLDDLADTLRYIGQEGARVFYDGDLGEAIVVDLQNRGGRLTRADLATYRAEARRPIDIAVADWHFWLNPPPAVGGAAVALALAELSNSRDNSPLVWVDALVAAFRARRDEIEMAIDTDQAVSQALVRAGMRSPSTIAVAAADSEGGAVAGTFSAGYGSGVVPVGTGLLMNNALGEIELVPGGEEAVVPGERMMSNMAPTVGVREGDSIAAGSPGADRITTAIFSTLAGLAQGLELAEAVDHPRVHPEFGEWGIRIAVEPGIDVTDIGYELRLFDELHMYFGGVNAAGLEAGRLTAHADIRRSGAIAIFG